MGCAYSQSYKYTFGVLVYGTRMDWMIKWCYVWGVIWAMFHSGSFRLTFRWWMTLQFFVYDEATQVILAGNAVHFLENPRCRNDYM